MLSCWLSYQLMLDIRWSIKIQWFCWWERERNYIYIYVILQCWGCLVWKAFCENFLLLNWYITLPSCCHKSWGQYMFQIPGKWEWSLSFCPHDSRRVELREKFFLYGWNICWQLQFPLSQVQLCIWMQPWDDFAKN